MIYHLNNSTIQRRIPIDVSRVLSEASSMSSYQLRKKDKGTKNVVERKDVFGTQQLQEYFKMSKNYNKYGTEQERQIKSYTNKQLRRKNII